MTRISGIYNQANADPPQGSEASDVEMLLGVMQSDAWRALSYTAQALYPWLKFEWHGPKVNNNGKLRLSVRQAAEYLGCNPNTAMRGFHDLQAKGFIIQTEGACLGTEGMGKSPSYELTEIPLPGQKGPGKQWFMNWSEGHDFPVKKGAPNNSTGGKRSMGIEFIRTNVGQPRARIFCDTCGRSEVVPTPKDALGRAKSKAQSMGWGVSGDRFCCPTCLAKKKAAEAARKAEKMAVKTTQAKSAVREPDKMQRRLIIQALEDAYDDQKQCYRSDSTDTSVAADLGSGILPGWVSQVRDELFGPAGNEEIAAIRQELKKLTEMASALSVRVDRAVEAHDKRVR